MSRGDGEAELIVISVSVCPGLNEGMWMGTAQPLWGSASEALSAVCDTSALGNITGMGHKKEY